jgi:hypothetical protein
MQAVKNERLMREVNDRIAAIAKDLVVTDSAEPVAILCECGDLCCFEPIAIELASYTAIRDTPSRYVVQPGHAIAEGEEIVEAHDDYHVVETQRGV